MDITDIINRLKSGEQIEGWGYSPGGTQELENQTIEYGPTFWQDISPTQRQGYDEQGNVSGGVFNPGEGYRRSKKYIEPLALAAFGTALGYGLLNPGAYGAATAGSGTAAGTAAGTGGSTLGSLGTVTQLGTPMAEAAAMGSSIPVANLTAGLPSLGAVGTAAATQTLGPLSQAAQWMKDNPLAGRLLMSGATSLLSAAGGSSSGGGGYKDSGYRPTITRGGWSPSVQAKQMPTQSVGLLNLPRTGQANSGLWRYGLLG